HHRDETFDPHRLAAAVLEARHARRRRAPGRPAVGVVDARAKQRVLLRRGDHVADPGEVQHHVLVPRAGRTHRVQAHPRQLVHVLPYSVAGCGTGGVYSVSVAEARNVEPSPGTETTPSASSSSNAASAASSRTCTW